MRIEACDFCGSKIYPLQGILFVKNNMRRYLFCTSKCIKYFEHKKNPRYFKWTKTYRLLNNKEPIKDSNTLWSSSKSTAVRYNRLNLLNALKLIKAVTKAKAARKYRFTLKNKLHIRLKEKAVLRSRFNKVLKQIEEQNTEKQIQKEEQKICVEIEEQNLENKEIKRKLKDKKIKIDN
eukprot:GAHX01001251.1.p1 GENE.GAHX01001251.1~~GAHX01001251.1.p1  ORF type:complete len:178 (+),score=38.16 GAHX01001251.1:43-576(+)